jgi:hypothetical protein
MNNDVLIVHSNYWVGISRLPVVLHAGGARVTVMAPVGSYLLATKYADEAIVVPEDMDEIIEALRTELLRRSYRLVILSDDGLLNALAGRSLGEPWIQEILPMPDRRSLELLASKITFLDRCREAGLPIAMSNSVSNCDEALRAGANLG